MGSVQQQQNRFSEFSPTGTSRDQVSSYLSMMTGSDGVSLRFPQLFLSQHRLEEEEMDRYQNIISSFLMLRLLF